MKFSALVFVAGLIASVAAIPDTASTAPAPTATSSYPPAVQNCLGLCPAADTTCRAKCLNNPAPTEQQAIDTTKCAAGCNQGGGSKEDTQKYSDCVQNCIKQYFLPTSTSGSGAATGTGSAGATGTGAYTSKSTSTSTSTAKSGAVSGPIVGTSFAGLMAIFVAVIAL